MKRPALILACALIPLSGAVSQTVMTLSDCLDEGLENSCQIRIVKNTEQQSANNDSWAYAGALPELALSGYYSNSDFDAQTMYVQLRADWTVFDGFGIQATRERLQELHNQGTLQTRITIEDYVAQLATEYYNLVRQTIRLKNLDYAVELSKERLRIEDERYNMGGNSRLELQQARVYFNADSAKSLRQQQTLASACIKINRLLSNPELTRSIKASDSEIILGGELDYQTLYDGMMACNAQVLKAQSGIAAAQQARRIVQSRNYPYFKLNAYYRVTDYIADGNSTVTPAPVVGATMGLNLVTGKQRIQERNALLDYTNAQISEEQVRLQLQASLDDLWQSYQNNLLLLALQQDNLETARETMEIAKERYMLGNLSGLDMREAQISLLDAEESLLEAQYNTKICEISLLQISGSILQTLK